MEERKENGANGAAAMPLQASLALTLRCNLNCPFCYERAWRAAPVAELSAESWLKVLRELDDMSVLRVRLSGGEPLLSPAFLPLVREMPHTRMRFRVITNGTLMEEAIARELAESRRCEVVQISLDGPEAAHDAIRGRGNFARAMAAITRLHGAGVPVKVNTVLNRRNLAELPRMLEAWEKLPITGYTLSAQTIPDEAGTALSLDDVARAACDILACAADHPKLRCKGFPFNLIDMLEKPDDDAPEQGGCLLSKIQINIGPDGAVWACPQLPGIVGGRVGETPLREIWSRSPELVAFRAKSRRDVSLDDPACASCRWRGNCRRWCPSKAERPLCYRQLAEKMEALGWRP